MDLVSPWGDAGARTCDATAMQVRKPYAMCGQRVRFRLRFSDVGRRTRKPLSRPSRAPRHRNSMRCTSVRRAIGAARLAARRKVHTLAFTCVCTYSDDRPPATTLRCRPTPASPLPTTTPPAPARACAAPRAPSRSSTTTRSRLRLLRVTQFALLRTPPARPARSASPRSPRAAARSHRAVAQPRPARRARPRRDRAGRSTRARARSRSPRAGTRGARGGAEPHWKRCAARRLASQLGERTLGRAVRHAARGRRAPASRTDRQRPLTKDPT